MKYPVAKHLMPHSANTGLWGCQRIISVQRGTISIVTTNNVAATIAPVVPENCVLRFLNFTNGGENERQMFPFIHLENATTVRAWRGKATANATVVCYELTEYAPGVIKSKQRGYALMTVNPLNIAIAKVDLTKTTTEFLGWRDYTSSGPPVSYMSMAIHLDSADFLTVNAGVLTAQQVGWEVTEWY